MMDVFNQTINTILYKNLPDKISYKAGLISNLQSPLFESEEKIIATAVAKRRQEFRAGRNCAKEALNILNAPKGTIMIAYDRQPIWPGGFIGSITHCYPYCAAITAKKSDYIGLGIDIMHNTLLEAQLKPMILRPEEILREEEFRKHAIQYINLVFSIKEAVFKAYYPYVLHFLEFSDILVTICPDHSTYQATLINNNSPALNGRRQFRGCWFLVENHIVTTCIVST